MLISREVDYSLRILRSLSSGELISTGDLCTREAIPQQFAYKIIKKLQKASFISIKRGAEGGCRLIADLNEKSLYDLLDAVDSIEPVNACTMDGYVCSWEKEHNDKCKIHPNLILIREHINKKMSSVKLNTLLEGDLILPDEA